MKKGSLHTTISVIIPRDNIDPKLNAAYDIIESLFEEGGLLSITDKITILHNHKINYAFKVTMLDSYGKKELIKIFKDTDRRTIEELDILKAINDLNKDANRLNAPDEKEIFRILRVCDDENNKEEKSSD